MEYLPFLTALAVLVMSIYITIRTFQAGETTMGIITAILHLCGCAPLVNLIYGWIKAKPWNMTTFMAIYTAVFLLNALLNVYYQPFNRFVPVTAPVVVPAP